MDILLGCGHSREKRVVIEGNDNWNDLCTVDINPEVKPDIEWDINSIPLPFSDNIADEIHAYNVLEHTGKQGDYHFFLSQFEDFWRVLKPGGYFCATVPVWNTVWALGDPGHTRIINVGTISFLDQRSYIMCDKSMRTDYRNIYKGNFRTVHLSTDKTETLFFVLKAIKGDVLE